MEVRNESYEGLSATRQDITDDQMCFTLSPGAVYLPRNHGLPVGLLISQEIGSAKALVTALAAHMLIEQSTALGYLLHPWVDSYLQAAKFCPLELAHDVNPILNLQPPFPALSHDKVDPSVVELMARLCHNMLVDYLHSCSLTRQVSKSLQHYLQVFLASYRQQFARQATLTTATLTTATWVFSSPPIDKVME